MHSSRANLVFPTMLFAVHVATAWALPQGMQLPGPALPILLLVFCLGLFFTQPVLLTAWVALGTPPPRIRVLQALLVALITCFAFLFSLKSRTEFSANQILKVLLLYLASLTLLSAACLVVRFRMGLRLVGPALEQRDKRLQHKQYRLRDLLLWTTVVAVAFATLRALAGPEEQVVHPSDRSDIIFGWIVAAVISIPGLFLVGAVLHRAEHRSWMVAAIVSAFVLTLLSIIPGIILAGDAFLLLFLFASCSWTLLLVQLILLKAAGWRIIRVGPQPIAKVLRRYFRRFRRTPATS